MNKAVSLLTTILFAAAVFTATGQAQSQSLRYKIGIMGCPSDPNIPWNEQNLAKLKNLGFNTMQLNIAWGLRPADEPLNLEDVIALPADKQHLRPKVSLETPADDSPQRFIQRRKDLHHRIRLCRKMAMRTLFHFGAPVNSQYALSGEKLTGKLPLCISDPNTTNYYVALMEAFAAEFPGVEDVLIYTYDQDAWLCSEFGTCPNCRGIPLHERIVPFINTLARTWHKHNPQGRLWWEPWELSAGQVLKSVQRLDPECVGMMLHSSIAEVMTTLPVDRWLKNTCHLAKSRRIPVVVEAFLGAPSEDVEPYRYLAFPLVTLRQAKAIAAVDGVIGIKEYYGIVPTREDANLRMSSLFLHNPGIDESAALKKLAQPYAPVEDEIIRFWKHCSTGMEIFPWDTSWMIQKLGRSNIHHSMSGAFIRGQMPHTPSWDSTRHAIFMKTDNRQPSPWMLEDVQLRCSIAAGYLDQALRTGHQIKDKIRQDWRQDFDSGLKELDGFKRRALAYAYHLRETNLAEVMRNIRSEGKEIPERMTSEMLSVLQADQENQGRNPELDKAVSLLQSNLDTFLNTYFLTTAEDKLSKGYHSMTSK